MARKWPVAAVSAKAVGIGGVQLVVTCVLLGLKELVLLHTGSAAPRSQFSSRSLFLVLPPIVLV